MATWTHLPAVRIGAIAVATALLVGAAPSAPAGGRAAGPEVTLQGSPTLDERAMVEWALARFQKAGLALPDLRVEFRSIGCGCRGRYNRSTQTIEVCDGRKMTLLHEMAHAWDHFAAFDREGFLVLRGIDTYFGPAGTPAAAEGAEHVAEILAWGLMDVETAVPGPAYPSQPVVDYRPRLAGLPNSGVEQLREAFVFLTGIQTLRGAGGP